MTRKKWFRVYHGMTADMTLAVCAQQAGISRGDMIALWLCLLESASRHLHAGSVDGFSCEEAALQLGLDAAQVTGALDALRQRKKIDSHQRIYGWDRIQPSSTARVRALRARRKQQTAVPAPAAKPPPAPRADIALHDSPAAIAARRARLQHNNSLVIGEPQQR